MSWLKKKSNSKWSGFANITPPDFCTALYSLYEVHLLPLQVTLLSSTPQVSIAREMKDVLRVFSPNILVDHLP